MSGDYRNRPPVDAPRKTVMTVLRSEPVVICGLTFVAWAIFGAIFAFVAVLMGWHW
jgi:hypothetical protein